MKTEDNTYSQIASLLDNLVSMSDGKALESHDRNSNECRIWEHLICLPKNEVKRLIFFLPQKGFCADNTFFSIFKANQANLYLIDSFDEWSHSEIRIGAKEFFLEFLFNSKNYNPLSILATNERIIENLYIERSFEYFNNEESFPSILNNSFEKMINQWKVNGQVPLLLIGSKGIGKTWAVVNFCIKGISEFKEDPFNKSLPIYLNLRKLVEGIPGVTNLSELLYFKIYRKYKFDIFGGQIMFNSLLTTGKIILVLDGLDEMSKSTTNELLIKNLWQILTLSSITNKYIITSRLNFFKTHNQLREFFAYDSFIQQNNSSPTIYNEEERRIRQNFNIWKLTEFNREDIKKLHSKVFKFSDDKLNFGLDKVIKFQEFNENTIEYELAKLVETPGYYFPLIRFLSKTSKFALIEIYEEVITNATIEYNIQNQRAINDYKLILDDQFIETELFETEKKNKILVELAWIMLERNHLYFDVIQLPKYMKEIENIDFEIVVNDLQTQTLFTLNDNGYYSFDNNNIFGLYISKYIFNKLKSSQIAQLESGIKSLGIFNLNNNEILQKAKLFLKEKIKTLNENEMYQLSDFISIFYKKSRPYSPWLKYLSTNCNEIGIHISTDTLLNYDFWKLKPISKIFNEVDKKMILIPGDEEIAPFLIGETEITNKDFYEFLFSYEFPDNSFCSRNRIFNNVRNSINPYKRIMNFYHIIFWQNDILPEGKEDHPIVWVSWFVAALYCNWLSKKEGLNSYYSFQFDNDGYFKVVKIRKGNEGYRLPNEKEWIHAAKDGNGLANSLLDIANNDEERIKIRRKFLDQKNEDTTSIKSESPNSYGVYGLVGNVREWVDDVTLSEVTPMTYQFIKGMGWLIGEEGLSFNHKTELLAQNNNVDVGFRIARSLNKHEMQNVDEAKRILNSLNQKK